MAIIKCPECGHQVSDHAATCPSCGIGIAGNVKKCPECGAVVFRDITVCPTCHSSFESPRPLQPVEATPPVKPATEVPQPTSAPSAPGSERRPGQGAAPTPEKPPRKTSVIVIVVTVVILLTVGFVLWHIYDKSQRQSEQQAYELALRSGEPGALQNYLDIYKDGPAAHRDSIQACLDQLMQADKEWADVVVSGSKVALERYLKAHPGSVHEREALQRIDSIDWVVAETEGTAAAYQLYIDSHAEGDYIGEARNRFEALTAQQVQSEDREVVSQVFGSFFQAFNANDEDALAATLQPVMDEFLTKTAASKNDVVRYMHRKHTEAKGTIEYRVNNDYKIEKQPSADGQGVEYTAEFTVDEKQTAPDTGASTINSVKVRGKIDASQKISSLKMERLKLAEGE